MAAENLQANMDVATVQKMLEPLFPGLMGVKLTAVALDRVAADMTVRADLCTVAASCMAAPTWPLPTPWAR